MDIKRYLTALIFILSFSLLIFPEDDKKNENDYKTLFTDTDKDLSLENWISDVRSLDVNEILSSYDGLEKEERDEIASTIQRLEVYSSKNESGLRDLNISVIIFNQKNFLKRYAEILENSAKKRFKELESNSMYTITDLKFDEFPGIKADLSKKNSVTIKTKLLGSSATVILYRIGREDILIEFFAVAPDLTDKTVLKITEKIFKKLEIKK